MPTQRKVLWLALFALLAFPHKDAGANRASRPIEVLTVDGARVRPLKGRGRRVTVLFFIAHDCPIANSYAPEIGRICRQYVSARIAFYVVYVESDLRPADARKHARDYGFPCPALLDPTHRLVRRVGATVTPEVTVVQPDGRLLYRGRIDDLYVDFGTRRREAKRHDLRLILDAVVAGKPVRQTMTAAIGCFIPSTITKK